MTKDRLLAVLGAILVALGAWNLNTTRATAELIARIDERQQAAQSVANEQAERTKAQDIAILELRTRVTALEIRAGIGIN